MTTEFNALSFSGEDMEDLFEQFSVQLRTHSRRVAICASIIAEYATEFRYLHGLPHGTSFLITMHLGGMCHDIGKLFAQNNVDSCRHPEAGADFLETHRNTLFANEEQAEIVTNIVRYHHERPDGRGFPYGLKKKDIPFPAEICAVANWLDNKIYEKKEFDKKSTKVFDEVSKLAGRDFSELAVICFERAKPRLIGQYEIWSRSKV